ncbi:MAG: hemolysin family protein [Chlamydiota bacterium]
MSAVELFFLTLFFLFGFIVTSFLSTALRYLGKFTAKTFLKEKKIPFYILFQKIFPKKDWNQLYLLIHLTQSILLLSSAITAFVFLSISSFDKIYVFFSIMLSFLFIDGFIRFLVFRFPKPLLSLSFPLSTFYLLLFLPITGLIVKAFSFSKILPEEKHLLKEKMFDFLREMGIQQILDPSDQKILGSLVTFKEKVAREVMVPRVNLFSLPSDISIKKAAKFFTKHGYSRIPVYKNTLDTIIGVLMYKDILQLFVDTEENPEKNLLNQTIEKYVKPVIYAPENKKISQLFQECKNKQTHIAIIVNEYGGTEGIVTIEDILEELVGEIEDEHDIDEERPFKKLPNGSYIVNAKMTILDIENTLEIRIPHHSEYETLGGYIFHRAGTIPAKGWKLLHDDFEIEILQSNERCLEKIRLSPIKKIIEE